MTKLIDIYQAIQSNTTLFTKNSNPLFCSDFALCFCDLDEYRRCSREPVMVRAPIFFRHPESSIFIRTTNKATSRSHCISSAAFRSSARDEHVSAIHHAPQQKAHQLSSFQFGNGTDVLEHRILTPAQISSSVRLGTAFLP